MQRCILQLETWNWTELALLPTFFFVISFKGNEFVFMHHLTLAKSWLCPLGSLLKHIALMQYWMCSIGLKAHLKSCFWHYKGILTCAHSVLQPCKIWEKSLSWLRKRGSWWTPSPTSVRNVQVWKTRNKGRTIASTNSYSLAYFHATHFTCY